MFGCATQDPLEFTFVATDIHFITPIHSNALFFCYMRCLRLIVAGRLAIKRYYRCCIESVHIHFKVSRMSDIEQIFAGQKHCLLLNPHSVECILFAITVAEKTKQPKIIAMRLFIISTFHEQFLDLTTISVRRHLTLFLSFQRIPCENFPNTSMSFTCCAPLQT